SPIPIPLPGGRTGPRPGTPEPRPRLPGPARRSVSTRPAGIPGSQDFTAPGNLGSWDPARPERERRGRAVGPHAHRARARTPENLPRTAMDCHFAPPTRPAWGPGRPGSERTDDRPRPTGAARDPLGRARLGPGRWGGRDRAAPSR